MGAGGADTSGSGQYNDVACPFCGIHCDDLQIARNAGSLKVLKNGCAKALAGFERAIPAAQPTIGGKAVSLQEAVAEAAKRIRAARLPAIGGMATDVDGSRAVMALADKAGAVVDHALSDAGYRNFRVLQTTGWVTTTLTEARNRADMFIVVGSDIQPMHPRFFERVVCADRSMFSDAPPKRTVVFLGEGLDTSGAVGPRIGDVVSLPAKPSALAEIMTVMRAMAKGVAVAGDSIGGLPRAAVENLLARIKAATYPVFVWSPPTMPFPNADLIVQATSELIKDLNATTRAAGLSLGGNEGSVAAAAVCAWQSGFPLRVSFASGKPSYDPERYEVARMVPAGETDLLVWIASYTPGFLPPKGKVPMIVLGTPGLRLEHTPDIFIPVGTPGADHDGLIVRCDNVVSLPLKNLGRAPNLPRTSDVLAAIEAAL